MNLELSEIEKEIILIIGDVIRYPPLNFKAGYNNSSNIIEGMSYKNKDDVYTYLKNKIPGKEFDRVLMDLFSKGLIYFSCEKSQFLTNIYLSGNSNPVIIKSENKDSINDKGIIRLTCKDERIVSGEEVYDYLLISIINHKQEKMHQEVNAKIQSVKEVKNSYYSNFLAFITIIIAVVAFVVANQTVFNLIEVNSYQEVLFIGLIISGGILFSLLCLLLSLKYLIIHKEKNYKDFFLLVLPVVLFILALLINLYINV
ncbi:MAG: hypothetical protein ACOC1O_04000 [bacterium]